MKIVKKKILKLSKYINIIENTVKVDNSLEKYHSFSQSDYVSILAISKKNKIILVKQFRPALKKNTIELPGGLRDKKEKHSITAKRELYEETGYSAGKLTFLGSLDSIVSISNGSAAANKIASTSFSPSLKDDGKFTTLSFFNFFIYFPL